MKISTKLKLSVLIPVLIGTGVAVLLIYAYFILSVSYNNGSIVQQIRTNLFEFDRSIYSYLTSNEEKYREQFSVEYRNVYQLIKSSKFSDPHQKQMLEDIRQGVEDVSSLFERLVSIKGNDSGLSGDAFENETRELYESILAKSKETDDNASRLRTLIDSDLKSSQEKLILFLISMLILVGFPTFVIILFLTRRIVSSIAMINSSTKIVGEGNLNFKIPKMPNDELGQLAVAFNHMTEDLKNVIISKHQLEKEIEERKKTQTKVLGLVGQLEKEKRLSEKHAHELELLTSELKKVQLAIENASDVILITSSKGSIVFVNKIVVDIFGYEQDELIGKNISFLGSKTQKEFYEKLWETISVDKTAFFGETVNLRKNGTEFPTEIHMSPVIDEKSNNAKYFVGILRDITAQKKIDQAKTEFISLAAHQLRTPISTIGLTSELLLRDVAGEMSEEGRNYLHSINEDIRYMTKLIRVFLDVSKFELGVFEIRPEIINPVQIAEKILLEFAPDIKDKRITLKKKFSKNIPSINLDKHILKVAFENIISNAVKYTEQGGQIDVRISKHKNSLLFKVSDNGCGIPKADQPKLFTKLYRASNARDNTGVYGFGLGLYLSKNLIKKSGGKFYFSSEEDKGSSFYISIPLTGMTEKKIKTSDF